VRKPVRSSSPPPSRNRALPPIDDLEPRRTRCGYDMKSIAEEFHIKPADVRLFLQGQLDLARSRELTEQMLVAGLPV
jgi:hypothetical protein